MKNWKTLLLLAVAVLLLIMSFQNLDPLPLRLLFWKVGIRPVILLPVMLFIGFTTGFFTRRKRG
jgi:uncharacterized integral membrane protein